MDARHAARPDRNANRRADPLARHGSPAGDETSTGDDDEHQADLVLFILHADHEQNATKATALPRTRSQFDRWRHGPSPNNASSAAVSICRVRHARMPVAALSTPIAARPSVTRSVIAGDDASPLVGTMSYPTTATVCLQNTSERPWPSVRDGVGHVRRA
jgi:hypothetical protein